MLIVEPTNTLMNGLLEWLRLSKTIGSLCKVRLRVMRQFVLFAMIILVFVVTVSLLKLFRELFKTVMAWYG